ncbi:MAG TPA: SHOCT domain-containing protein [Verrucomicrobiae bacterium]|nr:SHOCT domain-containing protein [Verrucomicrobiae bacterium]
MKKLFILLLAGLSAMILVAGCETHLGGGTTNRIEQPTVGQQLIDLQKAKEAGAISDTEYQAQKAKLLNGK